MKHEDEIVAAHEAVAAEALAALEPSWLAKENRRLVQMVEDLRAGAKEHGLDCGPYLKPGQHANFCGTFNDENCPLCADIQTREAMT